MRALGVLGGQDPQQVLAISVLGTDQLS